ADGLGVGTDMPTCVYISAALRELADFDPVQHFGRDTGALADLTRGESGGQTRPLEPFADQPMRIPLLALLLRHLDPASRRALNFPAPHRLRPCFQRSRPCVCGQLCPARRRPSPPATSFRPIGFPSPGLTREAAIRHCGVVVRGTPWGLLLRLKRVKQLLKVVRSYQDVAGLGALGGADHAA